MVLKITVMKPDGTLVGVAERISKKDSYSEGFTITANNQKITKESLRVAQDHLFRLANDDYKVEYYVIK